MTFAGEFLGLPGLRGYWPMGAFSDTGAAIDQSGNGRTLTYNGNPTHNYVTTYGAPYLDLDGTGDYLSRVDEAGLDILGTESYVGSAVRGLTMGGWFYFDTLTANADTLMSKWGTSTASGAYMLYVGTANVIVFITENSAGTLSQVTSSAAPSATAWHLIVGRFTPSTEVAVFIDKVKTVNTTSIITNLRNNAIALEIGNWSTGGGVMDGRVSNCFLCATVLSDTALDNLYDNTKSYYGL